MAEDALIEVKTPPPFVSRGGEKLAHALDRSGIDPAGLRCLDVGASTGGFTDCLLQRGAREVVAVDVAYGEIAQKLRDDPRVELLGIDLRAEPGTLVAFPSSMVHQVRPVTSGERYTLVSWAA